MESKPLINILNYLAVSRMISKVIVDRVVKEIVNLVHHHVMYSHIQSILDQVQQEYLSEKGKGPQGKIE